MPSPVLQEMVPTRDWGEPIDEAAAPGLRRFSIQPLSNPLTSLGLVDAAWARMLLRQIEMQLQQLQQQRMAQPMVMAANGLAYAPMTRIESDLNELERREKAQAAKNDWGQAGASDSKQSLQQAQARIRQAGEKLAEELWADSAGNLEMSQQVLERFGAKFSQEKYLTPDLMSLLLVSYEEVLWEQDGLSPGLGGAGAGAGRLAAPSLHLKVQPQSGAEAQDELGGPAGAGFAPAMQVVATAPQSRGAATIMPLARKEIRMQTQVAQEGLRAQTIASEAQAQARSQAARAEVEVRLISIREMLWHYFQAYPQDYPAALASVLGLTLAQVSDPAVLDQRIAFEVARSGSWALALRVWQEIVRHQKARSQKEGDGAWGDGKTQGGRARANRSPVGAQEADSLSEGMVPPRPRAGRSWWCWSPNWSGLNVGAALRSLAQKIFAS